MNDWLNDCKDIWDNAPALKEYFSDCLFDLKSLENTLYPRPWQAELSTAVQAISARLAKLGEPYEVYHPE